MNRFEKTYRIGNAKLVIYKSEEYIDIDVYENATDTSYSLYRYDSIYALTGSLDINDMCRQNELPANDVMDMLQKYALWYVRANFKFYAERRA